MDRSRRGAFIPAAAASLALHGAVLFLFARSPYTFRSPLPRPGYSVEIVSITAGRAEAGSAEKGGLNRASAAASRNPTKPERSAVEGPAPDYSPPAIPGRRDAIGGDPAQKPEAWEAPAAGKPSGTVEDDGRVRKEARIIRVLEKRIAENRRYPVAARRRGIQGSLTAEISVDERGALVKASVLSSSGSDLLDRAALELLRKVFPVDNDTGRLLDLKVSISYRLEGKASSPKEPDGL
jgi:TonB family protein